MTRKNTADKRDEKAASYVTVLNSGESFVIRDTESGSKALVPIVMDTGVSAEVVQVDKGLVRNLPEDAPVCDNLVFTLRNSVCPGITWVIELKGSGNKKQAGHAISQIEESIQYFYDEKLCPDGWKYIKNRDYVMAAIAGAPDKTIPMLNADEIKSLCRRLYRLSGKKVKDMFSLFCYIRPNVSCKNVQKRGNKPPYEIVCYNKAGAYLPFPSGLTE